MRALWLGPIGTLLAVGLSYIIAAFLESPMESPNIPTWNRIDTALPSFLSDLKKAVAKDNL